MVGGNIGYGINLGINKLENKKIRWRLFSIGLK